MIAASRVAPARDVLRRLSALGASIECRGDGVVLRVGDRPVPPHIIAAAREAKVELSKMLKPLKAPDIGEDERLRHAIAENTRLPAASTEGAQLSKSERLRMRSSFGKGADFLVIAADPAAKVLTQDAHLSAFDKGQDFCGFRDDVPSKVLNPVRVSAFGQNEHPRSSWGDPEEERAAIVEHDGRIPREWAEGFGRLNADRPPGDVPPERWQQFVDDVSHFLDSPFCVVAAALGWGPFDLFGCDRDRPFARIDKAGLLWLLNGDRLIAVTETTATSETLTGARLTFYRKPEEFGQVTAWEVE